LMKNPISGVSSSMWGFMSGEMGVERAQTRKRCGGTHLRTRCLIVSAWELS
jgi:hypothetical protein